MPGDLRARFSACVGAAHAIGDRSEMGRYLTEWRDRYEGRAALVLKPGSTAEVSDICKLASATGTGLVPQGGNTGLVGGQIPFEGGGEVVVSLERMNAIRDVDATGDTMTVEAGAILAAIQTAASDADRLFPLSLAAEGSCQIGGNLATNAGGTGVLAYGNTRDLVLGLEVVLASGEVWDGLRALKKDNTGYDLRDLFIGSEGTLGIITAAVLKLFPKPKAHATAIAALPDLDAMARLFGQARAAAGPTLTTFEMLSERALDFVLRHGENVRPPLEGAHPWYALIELTSSRAGAEVAETLETLLGAALEDGTVLDAALASSLTQRTEFWRLRDLMSEVQKAEGGSIKHDVSVPVARIPEFIAKADAAVEKVVPGARPVPFGHFGDGNIHYNVSQPMGAGREAYLARWDAMTEAVYDIVLSLGGSVSAEHGVGRMKRDLIARVKPPVEIEMMRAIKRALDPGGILNPGKVV